MHRLSLFSFVGSRLEAKVRKRANEACVEFLRVVDVEFLEATRAEEHCLATPSDAGASTPCALDDLVDYGTRRAEAALQRIGAKSGALPFSTKDASGYCIDFLRRKLVAARLLQQNLHECDWSTVDKASLQGMSADAKANLEEITDTWRASEISSFFTGRADWGLFASVFPCLWGEVADKLSTEDDRARALALVKSKGFRRAGLSTNRGYRSPSCGRLQDLGGRGEGAGETCQGDAARLDAVYGHCSPRGWHGCGEYEKIQQTAASRKQPAVNTSNQPAAQAAAAAIRGSVRKYQNPGTYRT